MQNYKRHKLQVYMGEYKDIPNFNELSKNKTTSYSFHYPGFLVGYMAWGYTICFHLVLVVCIMLRLVPLNNLYLQVVLTIAVPIVVVYFLKTRSISCLSRYVFTNVTEVPSDTPGSAQSRTISPHSISVSSLPGAQLETDRNGAVSRRKQRPVGCATDDDDIPSERWKIRHPRFYAIFFYFIFFAGES